MERLPSRLERLARKLELATRKVRALPLQRCCHDVDAIVDSVDQIVGQIHRSLPHDSDHAPEDLGRPERVRERPAYSLEELAGGGEC